MADHSNSSLLKKQLAPMVSAQSPQALGMLAVGLALNFYIRRMARRLRLGSPKSIPSNSVVAQLIGFQCYEINNISHDRGELLYNEMRLAMRVVSRTTKIRLIFTWTPEILVGANPGGRHLPMSGHLVFSFSGQNQSFGGMLQRGLPSSSLGILHCDTA